MQFFLFIHVFHFPFQNTTLFFLPLSDLVMSKNLPRDTVGARIFTFGEIFLLLYTDILQPGAQQVKLGSLLSDSKRHRHSVQMPAAIINTAG
jgi:hypothetical protein